MTDGIEGCTQVEEDEDGEESRIRCHFLLFQCYGVGGNRTGTVHTGYCGIGENGVMAAVLKDVGTVPVVREEWMMAVMRGTREGWQVLTSCVGRGSN